MLFRSRHLSSVIHVYSLKVRDITSSSVLMKNVYIEEYLLIRGNRKIKLKVSLLECGSLRPTKYIKLTRLSKKKKNKQT